MTTLLPCMISKPFEYAIDASQAKIAQPVIAADNTASHAAYKTSNSTYLIYQMVSKTNHRQNRVIALH
jgi:hypothetical protein